MTHLAIVILGQGSFNTAQRIKAGLPNSQILGLAGRVTGADVEIAEFGPALRDLYLQNRPIVVVCAAGIVIRTLASLLQNKRAEPPVLAVAEDGSAVVPLMGGLHGVNQIARQIGTILGTVPAITTTGEIRFNFTLEQPPAGYTVRNPQAAKTFMSDLLSGKGVRVEGNAPFLDATRITHDPDGPLRLLITTKDHEPAADELVLHPKSVVIAATGNWSNIPHILAEAGISPLSVAYVAVPETATLSLDFPIRLVPGELTAQHMVYAAIAEPELLGRGDIVIGTAVSPDAVSLIGHKRGRLAVVGLGPGSKDFMPPAVKAELARAQHIIGYFPYVEMAGPFRPDQTAHASDNRVEMDRSRHAFSLAAKGEDVVVVSSGDPGIFAMATAVIEALHQSDDPTWHGVELVILPGISAANAAASLAGAPLGHDFCVMSLSDNLKPWEVIETRLELATKADFALAFYNPISKARPWQLGRALEIIRANRASQTPVVLGRNVGRPGETIIVTTLGDLTPDMVDMRTVVIIGSSVTKTFERADGGTWVYTPRWYE